MSKKNKKLMAQLNIISEELITSDWISPNGIWEIVGPTFANCWTGYIINTRTTKTTQYTQFSDGSIGFDLSENIPNYVLLAASKLWQDKRDASRVQGQLRKLSTDCEGCPSVP